MAIVIKLVNSNGSLLANRSAVVPSITTAAVNDLTKYSNTTQVLAFDAITYANTIAYVTDQNFVNTAQLSSNLANYPLSNSLTLDSLTDIEVSVISNNSTLVYDVDSNKYIVKPYDLDGGIF
jgi:hypothetical protein